MKRAVAAVAAVAVFALVAASCGGDEAPPEPAVAVANAWALPTSAVATNGAVYLDLEASTDDALVALSVDPTVAAAVELHETVRSDAGLTSMRQMPALQLRAGEPVSIESGSYHAMLVELAQPLVDGATFELRLEFEFAPDVTVDVAVDGNR